MWAVGNGSSSRPLILHFNGKAWSAVSTTGIGSDVGLQEVVAPASKAVWVDGVDSNGGVHLYRLSGSRWVTVPSPAAVPSPNITSGPDGQIWAFSSGEGNAVARWTGTAWHVYHTGPSSFIKLTALSFVSTSDGYAVGYTVPTNGLNVGVPAVDHWNGTSWQALAAPPLPKAAGGTGELVSVLATKSDGAWAIGEYQVPGNGILQNWLAHWNGSSWSTVALPAGFDPVEASLRNISVAESGEPQWMSGSTNSATSAYDHYAAGTWTFVRGITADGGQGDFDPELVSVPGSNATWAIGTLQSANGSETVPHIEYAP